jgi:hypothetical protein
MRSLRLSLSFLWLGSALLLASVLAVVAASILICCCCSGLGELRPPCALLRRVYCTQGCNFSGKVAFIIINNHKATAHNMPNNLLPFESNSA